MVMVLVAERDPTTQDLVNQEGEVVPECSLGHVQALRGHWRAGEVDEPLGKAGEEVGINVVID